MEKRFIVTNHEYINTGGNTMVSVFAVYDQIANISRWVIVNEEGIWWQTADTISGELRIDSSEMHDKIVIGYWTLDTLVYQPTIGTHEFTADEFDLFKYCQFEYYKKDCRHFGIKYRLSVDELPRELYWKLSLDYREWSEREGVGCLTDGYDVFMDDGYEPPAQQCDEATLDDELKKTLQDMKDFSEWLKKFDYDAVSFGSYITVAVAGNSVKIPFHADTYELLDSFLDKAIEEF